MVVSDDASAPSLAWVPEGCSVNVELIPPLGWFGPLNLNGNFRSYLLCFTHTVVILSSLVNAHLIKAWVRDCVIKHYLIFALPQTPDGKEKKSAPGGRGNMQYSAHAVNLQLMVRLD